DAFPYSIQVLKYWAYLLRTNGMGETYLANGGGDIAEFWKYSPAAERMMALIERFSTLGKQYGFVPVLVFIPEGGEVLRYWQSKADPIYKSFASNVRAKTGMLTIDILDQPMNYEKFNILPFGAHASPYGNRVIATAIFNKIRDMPEIAPFARKPGGASQETGVDMNLSGMTQ